MLSFRPMVNSPCLLPGITHFACGILTLGWPLVVFLVTLPMFSLSASAPTIDKSSLAPVTRLSSCGIHSGSASTISKKRGTQNGLTTSLWHIWSLIIVYRRVSCVRFSPNVMNPVIVSSGWDKVVKVCNIGGLPVFLFCCVWCYSIYICYFRGLTLYETIFPPRSLTHIYHSNETRIFANVPTFRSGNFQSSN